MININHANGYQVVSESNHYRLARAEFEQQVFSPNGDSLVTAISWSIQSKDGQVLGQASFIPPEWLYLRLPSQLDDDMARMSAQVLTELSQLVSGPAPAEPNNNALSPRETEVLTLLCDGATSDQIAHALGIAADTVNSHIGGIRDKFSARNRVEAVAAAFRNNFIPINDSERPSVVEVRWQQDGTVGDLVVRYGFSSTINNSWNSLSPVLDSSVATWAGECWQENLRPLIAALEKSRSTGQRSYFQGVKAPESLLSLGWVEPTVRNRFLVVTPVRGVDQDQWL